MAPCAPGGCCNTTKEGKPISRIQTEGRGCTDVVWFLLFWLSWAGVGVIYYMAVQQHTAVGKHTSMWNSFADVDGISKHDILHRFGNICGVDAGYEDKPLGAASYPWSLDGYKTLHCVKSCADTQSVQSLQFSALYPSIELLYYCIPVPFTNVTLNVEIEGDFNPALMEAYEAAGHAAADIYTSRFIILASLGLALVVAFMFCIFLKCCAKTMIYSLLFIIVGLGFTLGQLLLNHAKRAELNGSHNPVVTEYLEYAGYIIMGATGLCVVILFFFRNQIDIAIEVTKEAARVLLDMKCLILFPVLPAIVAIAYFVLWGFVATTVYSTALRTSFTIDVEARTYQQSSWSHYMLQEGPSNTLSTPTGLNPAMPTVAYEYTVSDETRNILFYHLFHFFWVTQFIFYFAYLVFAGAAADWYFTAQDASGRKKRGSAPDELRTSPICASCCRAFRYNLGTVALCAFIIAVIKTLRAIVTYVEQKTKGDPPNKLQKAVFCAIKCFLHCLECCMDKVNKYALVWTAVYGDNFIVSACSSFALVWRNLFRVAAVNMVSTIVFFMGKVSIGLITAALVAALLEFGADRLGLEIVSPLGPAVMVFVGAYCVATLFFVIFSSTIDAIFLCFLIDSENNDAGQMFASKSLQKLVGKYENQSKIDADIKRRHRHERGGKDVKDFYRQGHVTSSHDPT